MRQIILIVGGIFGMICGVMAYLGKYDMNRNFLEVFISGRVPNVIIKIVLGTICVLFGLYFLLKGLIDPYGRSMWINF